MATGLRLTLVATLVMIIAQLNLGIITVTYKYTTQREASPSVLVAGRQVVAAILLLVSTFIIERFRNKIRNDTVKPKITWKIIFMGFLCGLFGSTISYNLFIASLKWAPTTSATAITNLFPAITFIMAVIFRREKVEIHKWSGRAKVVGTCVAIAGAMIISLYKGKIIQVWPSKWQVSTDNFPLPEGLDTHPHHKNSDIIGILIALASCISSAASIIIEDKLLEMYPSQLRATSLIVGVGAIQCSAFAIFKYKHLYAWIRNWEIGFTITEFILIYSAMVGSGIMMVLTAWCISRKGSFFVSIFSPVTLIMVALVSPLVLEEPLHLGSVIGAIIIICGIYLVIWGKKEDEPPVEPPQEPPTYTMA